MEDQDLISSHLWVKCYYAIAIFLVFERKTAPQKYKVDPSNYDQSIDTRGVWWISVEWEK